MALTYTLSGGIWQATIRYRDIYTRFAETELHADASLSEGDFSNFVQAFCDLVDKVTDCKILSYRVSKVYVVGGSSSPVDGALANEKARLTLRTAFGKASWVSFPAPNPSVLISSERTLNTSHPDIAALVTLLESGDGTVQPTDSNGSDLETLLTTDIRTRKVSYR
jgi:hypothetical protein